MPRRIEVRKIAETVAERVANLAIGVAELRHDALAHLYVGLIFDAGDPKPQQIRAPALANLGGIQRVAERLRHRLALFVERPAVGDYAFVGRIVMDADADQQRAVEPAGLLIGAFGIK